MNQPCECNRLKLQLEIQVKENQGLREDLREMDADRRMQQLQITDQMTHIDELQEALLEIEEKLNHMQSNIHEQREQWMNDYGANLNSVQNKYEHEIAGYVQRVGDLEHIINDQQNLNETLSKECKHLKKQAQSHQDTIDNLKSLLQANKKQIETNKVDKTCLDNRSRDLKTQNDNLHKLNKQLEMKVIDHSDELEKLKKKIALGDRDHANKLAEQDKANKKKLKHQKLLINEMSSRLRMGMFQVFQNLKLELQSLRISVDKDIGSISAVFTQLVEQQLKLIVNTANTKIASEKANLEQQCADNIEQVRNQLQQHFKQSRDKLLREFEEKQLHQEQQSVELQRNLKQQITELESMNAQLEREIDDQNKLEQDMQQKIYTINEQQLQIQELAEQNTIYQQEIIQFDSKYEQLIEQNSRFKQKSMNEMLEDKNSKKQLNELLQSNQYLKKQLQLLSDKLIDEQDQTMKLRGQMPRLNSLSDADSRHIMRLSAIKKH